MISRFIYKTNFNIGLMLLETNVTDPDFLGLNPQIRCVLFRYVSTPLTCCRKRCNLPAAPFFLSLNFGVLEKDSA